MFTGLYARLIGAGLIAAAVIAGWLYVSNLRTKVDTLTSDKVRLQAELDLQSASILAAKQLADTQLAAAKVELDAAKAETEKAKKRSVVIYKQPPSNPNDLCKSALDLMNAAAAPASGASQ